MASVDHRGVVSVSSVKCLCKNVCLECTVPCGSETVNFTAFTHIGYFSLLLPYHVRDTLHMNDKWLPYTVKSPFQVLLGNWWIFNTKWGNFDTNIIFMESTKFSIK